QSLGWHIVNYDYNDIRAFFAHQSLHEARWIIDIQVRQNRGNNTSVYSKTLSTHKTLLVQFIQLFYMPFR
ncbi:MAG: hypothetical protein JSV68_01620, partial [Anaerolineaceae bacterium]